MRRKTCVVWNYFTELSAQDAVCNVCGRNVRYHRSNTNLRSHLRVWHRKIWCQMTSGEIESPNPQSVNYGSAPNGVGGGANEQVTYVSDSSNPAYMDRQDVSNHLNNLPTTNFGFMQQQQQQQQQPSPQQSKHNLSLKSSPPHSPSQQQQQHQNNLSMGFPNLPRGMYITQNVSPPERLSEPPGFDNYPASHIQDSNNFLHSIKKPEEELSETDRTRDSGVISTDDCDIMESKEAIAAQIEMMRSSSFTTSELTDASQTAVGNNSRIGDPVLSHLNLSHQLASASENKADGETDSIAEYFKICDNNTRQTFLDVMRNDREQHLSALDKINTEMKTVKLQMQQTKTEHILKEQQLQEMMKQMNLLQMEVLSLHSRNTELSDREKTLQRKMKTYTKKVSLCDSALNAMTNER